MNLSSEYGIKKPPIDGRLFRSSAPSPPRPYCCCGAGPITADDADRKRQIAAHIAAGVRSKFQVLFGFERHGAPPPQRCRPLSTEYPRSSPLVSE